jgi:hypothetical protein
MSDNDDPFMVVKPDDENKKMSSYLKKNERGDRKKGDVENSSHGSTSTRSTATSTAQDDTTHHSASKTPESKSKTGAAFGGFGDDPSAIEFNSDFGNGLEFGGFAGDDGFGKGPQSSSHSKKGSRDKKKKTKNNGDAFDPEAFGNSFDNDAFGGSFHDSQGFEGFGGFNEREEPINFGDDGFNAAFGENSRSQQDQQQQNNSKDEAWRKREAWKKQGRSNSTSGGASPGTSSHRRGTSGGHGHRRGPVRTGSKGDVTGMDKGSGHGRPDDSPRAPRSDRHMMSRGEGRSDDNPKAPRSERLLVSRGDGHSDGTPRTPKSGRHLMSKGPNDNPAGRHRRGPVRTGSKGDVNGMDKGSGHGHSDDSPRVPRSERLLVSRGEAHPEDSPRVPRSERLLVSRGEDDNPRAPRSERHMMSRGDQERSPQVGERSPIRRNRSGTGPGAGPRMRRVTMNTSSAEAPPQRGPPSEPERGNLRPQRSRRRASLAMPSRSDGDMEMATRSPATPKRTPQRNKSVDGMPPMMMEHLSGGPNARVRAPPKEFLRNRSDNQQKIMDMYKGGALTGDQKPRSEQMDVSIDTVPDASLGNAPHEGGGGGGIGLGKLFGGKSKKAEKLGDGSDHVSETSKSSKSSGGFVIPDHEPPPRRGPRRASLAFVRKKTSEEPKEADYTENRNLEGRNRATLLERVAATADKPSCNGDAGSEGTGVSYSDRIVGAQRRR